MKPLRLGFVLCSPLEQPIPSTRIAVLNILPHLKGAGFETRILFASRHPTETPELAESTEQIAAAGCDVVVFQKVRGGHALALARHLASRHIRTIFLVCDVVDIAMAEATDATVVVTAFLRSLYPPRMRGKIHVVPDGIERPAVRKSDWGARSADASAPMKAVLVTSTTLDRLPVLQHPPAWLRVRVVGRYENGRARWSEVRWRWSAQSGHERLESFRFLMDRRICRVSWGNETVYDELRAADIGIIPVQADEARQEPSRIPSWSVKSENRLTLKMSVGLPVIASPIPSYESVIDHGVNGFIARSRSDWIACLEALRDPARRKEVGRAARESVKHRFSLETQAAKLIEVIHRVTQTAPRPASSS